LASVVATEANRNFSALLRRAAAGERITITSRGRPVAELGPPQADPELAERMVALDRLLARVKAQGIRDIEPWTRDELYEREEP
jgi:prevent-host-death family protein